MPWNGLNISADERIRCGHRQSQRIGHDRNSRDVDLVSTCTYQALTWKHAAKSSSLSL